MNTPILGGCSLTSNSSGSSFFDINLFLTSDKRTFTRPAAALASITVSGISFGAAKAPQT